MQNSLRRAFHISLQKCPVLGRYLIRWTQTLKHWRLIKTHRVILLEVLEKYRGSRPIVIFAPSLDWKEQLFQRPQQFAMAFARQGALVFYLQHETNEDQAPFCELYDRMFICNTVASTFDIVPAPFVYFLTWNSGYQFRFSESKILYDYVDNINAFDGDLEFFKHMHQYMLQKADIVIATSNLLHKEVLSQREDALLCPNAVEYQMFSRTNRFSMAPPDDLQPLLENNLPLIGYYGALASWFDYSLVEQISILRPDYHFVLVGPDYAGSIQNHALLQRPNIRWLGKRSYHDLPAYLAFFDVAIIPFVLNEITHAASPLKLFEYMAGGKPVVITPMDESMRYPGVFIGRTPDEFVARLDDALKMRDNAEYLKKINDVARINTWDARARSILDSLKKQT